ncbi:MAG: M28 family peptidase [Planctomycetes bacterium]|nr:M28 family peptidase [Planctomycetota bacterium]
MPFDAERALAHARALSFPRRIGSPGEAAAADQIADRLAAAGLRVTREVFHYSLAPLRVIRSATLLSLVALAVSYVGWSVDPTRGIRVGGGWRGQLPLDFAAATGAVAFLMTLPVWWPAFAARCVRPLLRPGAGGALTPRAKASSEVLQAAAPSARLPEASASRPPPPQKYPPVEAVTPPFGWLTSANVVGRLEPWIEGAPTLHLVAHMDSKSQWLPLALRLRLIAFFIASTLGWVLFLVWIHWGGPVMSAGALLLGHTLAGLSLLLGGALCTLGVGDASPGAVDNASAVGVMIALAEAWSAPERRGRLNLLCVATAGEEACLVGANAHVQSHRRRGMLYGPPWAALNLESVGGAGTLYRSGGGGRQGEELSASLAKALDQAAAEVGVPLARLPVVVGAMMDHLPFQAAGIEAWTLVPHTAAYWHVHTSRDTADRIDVNALGRAGRVADAAIGKWRDLAASPIRSDAPPQ